ncbi:peptidyl-prolyl cis-trans isomerase [Desulfosarcina alkanivorans]|uniref:Peptidyl-prolyl cis-trans isomerase n=1 Tax=Desulfosarcina alkanivorans TaxID=571177 RepID=A0A5K7YHC5_9BACT|nr:FKBP-type peptidyl-prolyl cis-trans isomerase [Desulfosarcina alkanivorans]BBO66101.1 peptidyl-prolyl cis-trans isomerase [Desulfosarcina alkanivorans]
MRNAQKGDTVLIKFTCSFDDGSEITTTGEKEPLELTIGEGKLIDCFEQSLIGMSEGQQKTIHLRPEQVVGERRPELISELPLHVLPEQDEDLEVGSRVMVKDNNGNDVKATVTRLTDQNVTIDANHPLAGEALTFDVELIEFAYFLCK